VLGVFASGAHVAFTVSHVAHATNDQSLEAWGNGGALRYRLTLEVPRWFEGEVQASRADFQVVAARWTPPAAAGDGDQSDVMGKALIAPLVERMLHGIRTGQTPSPSLVDGSARRACSTPRSNRRGAACGSTSKRDDGPPDPVAAGDGGDNLSRLRFPSWAEQPDC
jgi:hypothetical protein